MVMSYLFSLALAVSRPSPLLLSLPLPLPLYIAAVGNIEHIISYCKACVKISPTGTRVLTVDSTTAVHWYSTVVSR